MEFCQYKNIYSFYFHTFVILNLNKQSQKALACLLNTKKKEIFTSKHLFIFYPNVFIKLAISIAASAASEPLLPAFVPARSIACSIVSVVNTPNIIGNSS